MCSRAAPMMTLPAELPAICTGSDPGAEVNITMSGPNEGFRRIGLRIFPGRFGPQLHSKDCYQHDDRVDRDSRKGDLFGDIAPYACSGLQAVSHHHHPRCRRAKPSPMRTSRRRQGRAQRHQFPRLLRQCHLGRDPSSGHKPAAAVAVDVEPARRWVVIALVKPMFLRATDAVVAACWTAILAVVTAAWQPFGIGVAAMRA